MTSIIKIRCGWKKESLVKQKLKKLKKFDDKLPLFFEDKLRDWSRIFTSSPLLI
jgi:hypothetical protein